MVEYTINNQSEVINLIYCTFYFSMILSHWSWDQYPLNIPYPKKKQPIMVIEKKPIVNTSEN